LCGCEMISPDDHNVICDACVMLLEGPDRRKNQKCLTDISPDP
jgi:hypothetical protein